ncbi:MAG: hypothetical protein UY85_C0050G0002 [Candidatus Peribacteria bacterium GW2011_GWB1_54_5]|nr:MAG: hypothetical protein UY85_C0050G0002 [Candidatus Peribacteria bacterium GW2011_GWB1_54_5]KKW39856.1 MAG: hypothetical protein UY90_C0095G0002 [Candidatus Peregrinibacteria bacterium GW2011_GWA2_54_9]OGJ76566.1 MAG: hypothetical protein A2327_05485 [Candidatus Peribacteria bacterium RIFOXYB2_FULL_54_17]OGJ83358.1 MAG: hypothetical protein A2598_02070 [Candidatus Peribacteria bacterium RIFOXYD1_FULL_54_13]
MELFKYLFSSFLMSKKFLNNLCIGFVLLLFPITTHADVILPGAAVVMGLAYLWPLLLIIFFIETVVIKMILKVRIYKACFYAAVMNSVSTIVGIPVMFGIDLSLLYSMEHILDSFDVSNGMIGSIITFSMVALYVVCLFLASVIVEWYVLRLMKAPLSNRKKAVIYANISSYALFAVIAVSLWIIANVM